MRLDSLFEAFNWVLENYRRPSQFERDHHRAWDENLLQKTIEEIPERWMDMRTRIRDEFLGAGPLADLLSLTDLTEIMVNDRDSIYFEQHGKIQRCSDCFLSDLTFNNFIHRLSEEGQFDLTLERPFADAQWRGFRLHLVRPPLVATGFVICLRKHPENPWTFAKLREQEWAPPEALSLIENLINERKSFLVVGSTGSGKTSVLNACLQNLGESERVVVIEDVDEIRLPNALGVKLLTRHDPHGSLSQFDQSDLLKLSLRMRPDRIVVGEVRGSEAKDLLMALATGHRGSLSSMHAESPSQALLRLEMLVQLGAPQWSIGAIRRLISLSLDAILVTQRVGSARRLAGIHQLSSLEESGFLLDPIWES